MENLELAKFQFFKYPPKVTSKPVYLIKDGKILSVRFLPDHPSRFQDAFNRIKAVTTYFRNLLFGNPQHRIEKKINFPPDRGEKLSDNFQRNHGKNGENLVNLLGSGASSENLVRAGALK